MGANSALITSAHKESIKTISERDEEDCEEDYSFQTVPGKGKKKTIDVDVDEYKVGRSTERPFTQSKQLEDNKESLLE